MPRGSARIICNGKEYCSQKHPLLEYIFHKYNPNNDTNKKLIPFTLADISEAYSAIYVTRIDVDGVRERVKEPASISNTILDLVRQDRGIKSRLPDSLILLGYDLRKRTGLSRDQKTNLAGEFVYVGYGKELSSWLVWPTNMERTDLSSTTIPGLVETSFTKR